MSQAHRFRMAISKYWDQPLTPEIAAAIEAEAFHEPDLSIDPLQFASLRCGSLTLQVERLSTIQDEIHPLHEAHWLETEGYLRGLSLNMDYDTLKWEERRGTLIQFTARCGAQLVGNFRLYLRMSRHTQTKVAIEDTLFLLQEHRRGRNALRLLDYAGQVLRSLGYNEFRASTKLANPAAARLLQFRGFKPVATEFVLIDQE